MSSQRFPIGAILARSLLGEAGLFYYHLGIYIGDNRVIHFNGERKGDKNSTIKNDSMGQFTQRQKVFVYEVPADIEHGLAVRRKAMRYWKNSKNKFNGDYDFMSKNCEDFCRACFNVPPWKRDFLSQRDITVGGLCGLAAALLVATAVLRAETN